MLIDYGCGAPLSNERLLLEYGFVLEELNHDQLELPFGAIAIGIAALQAAANKGGTVGEAADEGSRDDDVEAMLLGSRQQALLAQLGDVERTGLVFGVDGRSVAERFETAKRSKLSKTALRDASKMSKTAEG